MDERKERLQKIEQQARETLGLTPHKPLDQEQIHQAFRAAMPHLSKKKRCYNGANQLIQVVLLLFLLALFYLILLFIF
ncbi:hypothetical protein [Segatella salivae]|uniref:hypothetical protein n=1 Tax=Segatella salivae TaxID=228604 RepID=UPI001E48A455|nr:hypothetical protein [Segatella salivae]